MKKVRGLIFIILLSTGLEVDYAGQFLGSPNLQPGTILVRCILLLWTGDYLAQSEVGKFIQGGIYPCRRDKLKGTISPVFSFSYPTNIMFGLLQENETSVLEISRRIASFCRLMLNFKLITLNIILLFIINYCKKGCH